MKWNLINPSGETVWWYVSRAAAESAADLISPPGDVEDDSDWTTLYESGWKVQIDSESLADKVIAGLPDEIDLEYVHYDSSLNDQPSMIEGWIHGGDFSDFDKAWDSGEAIHHGVQSDLEYRLTKEEREIIEDTDAYHRLYEAIQDRNSSDVIGQLLRNTSNMLVLYEVPIEVDAPDWTSEPKDAIAFHDEAIEALKLPDTPEVRAKLKELTTESGYGGQLYLLWYGDLDALVKLAWSQKQADLVFDGVCLLVLDRMNGSGHDVTIKDVQVTVPFIAERIELDDAHRYSWNDVAGVVKSAYVDAPKIVESVTS